MHRLRVVAVFDWQVTLGAGVWYSSGSAVKSLNTDWSLAWVARVCISSQAGKNVVQ